MKTRVICTLGPASETVDQIKALIKAGMNVARINRSHNPIEHAHKTMLNVRKAAKEAKANTILMLDTKGPDVRIGFFKGDIAEVKEGQAFTIDCDPKHEKELGDHSHVFANHAGLPKLVKKGQELRLNDGMVIMTVTGTTATEVKAKVVIGGTLKNRKSLAVPGCDLKLPFISELDEADIADACTIGIDWIAASFTSTVQDVKDMRALLKKHGGEKVKIISKIESRFGVENFDGILKESDGIMVARGDLGVEFEVHEIPALQKMIVEKTKKAGKTIVVATEMMESMIEKPRPTRAEVSDVANAVWDGADLVMLSGETAAGRFPIRVVEYMCRAAAHAEKFPQYYRVK